MTWYVELTYADGSKENMYCASRDEARAARIRFLRYSNVIQATVRKVQ